MGSHDLAAMAAAEKAAAIVSIKTWSTDVVPLPSDDVIHKIFVGLHISDYNYALLAYYKTAIKGAASLETFSDIRTMITTVNATALDDAVNYIGNISGETTSQSNTDIGGALVLVDRGQNNYKAANFDGYKNAIEYPSAGPLTSKAEIQAMIKGVNAGVTSIENVAGSTVNQADLEAMISAAGVNNYDSTKLDGYVAMIENASSGDLNTWVKIQAKFDGVSTTQTTGL
jgi:hypothetical protein